MVEYLAAVHSLDADAGAPGSELRDDARAARQQLLLVAISEMRHLREVNSVLLELHRRTGGTAPFTPALGIATVLRGTAGFPDREVRFRRLTPDVMDEFVRVEAPSLTVDGLYNSLLAAFERDGDDDLADGIRSVMADGSEHFATFRAIQEWLSRHDPADYLRPLAEAPAGDQGLRTLQQRYELVLDLLFQGYRLGVPAGTSQVNNARAVMLGPGGSTVRARTSPSGASSPPLPCPPIPASHPSRPPHRVTVAVPTAVLGSGAVALARALFQARHGPVVLAGRQETHVPGVERVAAALLTLLLELGVVPGELDVDRLTRTRLVAGEEPSPAGRVGPTCAHLDRTALVDALWRRVRAHQEIQVVPPVVGAIDVAFGGTVWRWARVVDATGRRALTATGRLRPDPVWVAACCTVPRGDSDPTMQLAVGPTGYAYRLGSARWLTVAWVAPGAHRATAPVSATASPGTESGGWPRTSTWVTPRSPAGWPASRSRWAATRTG